MQAGLTVAGLMFTGLYLLILVGGQGFLDAHAYWATDLGHLYQGAVVGGRDAYLYSPAFAQLIWPLTQVPFPVFAAFWFVAEGAGLLWLLRPLPWSWQVPFLLLASPELVSGNIHVFLAVAIVLGFRYPAAWAAVLLTKVTPGIGLLWFAVRREWRSLAIALAATVVIAAVSFACRAEPVARLVRGPPEQHGHRRRQRAGHPHLGAPATCCRDRRLGRPHRPALDGRRCSDAGGPGLLPAHADDAVRHLPTGVCGEEHEIGRGSGPGPTSHLFRVGGRRPRLQP